jgi:soluble lytic murein transglycosylase
MFISHRAVQKGLYPEKYNGLVEKYSAEYGVDKCLIYAVLKCESGFNPSAVSGAGALGLMQITPETFEWVQQKSPGTGASSGIISKEALYDPETAIKYGTLLLSLHLDEFQTQELALSAYHAGRGQVNGWLADGTLRPGGSPDDIPFPETRNYVKRVMKTYETYRELYK